MPRNSKALEVIRRGGAEGLHRRIVEPIGDADALERALNRIAQRSGESGAGLREVLQQRLVAGGQVDRLVELDLR